MSESELEEEEEEAYARDNNNNNKRGQRRRAVRAVVDSDSDSDDDEDGNAWASDGELDKPLIANTTQRNLPGDGWRQVNRGPLHTSQQRRHRGRGQGTSSSGVLPNNSSRPSSRAPQTSGTATGLSNSHRAVQSITERYDELRAGTATFEDVVGAERNVKNKQQPSHRRSRQSRDRQTTQSNPDAVIDLCDSPVEEKPTQRAEHPSIRRALSPPLISLSSKIRQELSACREKGARLPPTNAAGAKSTIFNPGSTIVPNSTPASGRSALWRLPHSGTPGSSGHRMRTARDFAMGAQMVRQTPINGNGRSSPPPLQERLAARAAAEWGSTYHGGIPQLKPHNAPTAAGQPQQQQPFRHPQWRQTHSSSTQRQQEQQLRQRQFMPRPAEPVVPQGQPSNESNAGDRTPPPVQFPRRDIPLFLRNNPQFSDINDRNDTTSQQGPQEQLPSPNYSLPPRTHHSQRASSHGSIVNLKEQAHNMVKGHVRGYLDAGAITGEQYKAIAKVATHSLVESKGTAMSDASMEEIAKVVDNAMVAVIKGKLK